MEHRIGVIGGGNMGGAIVRGAINARLLAPGEIIVVEVDDAKRHAFIDRGCATSGRASDAANADQIIFAVKPQAFESVAKQIRPLHAEQVVISIMAGLNSGTIRRALGGEARIVRAMPNVACQIGAGMTAIALGEGAQPGDEQVALSIFNALGRTVTVDEPLMYAVTAVSGSGPAYIFLLAEAMEQAAIRLGIDPDTARVLVEQTVFGAGRLLGESDQSAAQLRAAVTSPGGTTAAALDVFGDRDFVEIVIEALTAARDRGRQLDA